MTAVSAPAANFSGKAEFTRFPVMPASGDVAPAIVHFDAGTITNWHIHPKGQYMIVTEGEGRTQHWGGPIEIIRQGDVVWCPPGVKHWHGAGEHTAMSHVVISPVADNQPVQWLEKVDLPPAAAAPALIRQTTPLTRAQLAIAPIAALSAVGDLEKLKPALAAGLDSGLSPAELEEVFAHQYAYAGFPRALNGLLTLQAVLKERGITPPQQAPIDSRRDYYQLGQQNLADLSGRDPNAILFDSNGIDYALKAHLFGYLFSREQLSSVNRQLVTVSTLSALGNVQPQLASHVRNTQNLGVSQAELARLADVLQREVGAETANHLRTALNAGR
ncbi:cupin domain-containing carboxymuconolactone decarboxylase family protein [Testudinibacter sp. P27/CKL/0425]